MSFKPFITTAFEIDDVLPWPSCPLLLSPQHLTTEPTIAHPKSLPTARSVAPAVSGIICEVDEYGAAPMQ